MLSYPFLRLATTENYSGVFLARASASTALPSVQTACGRSWSAHGSMTTHGGTASRKLRSSSSRPPPFTLLMARCLLCKIDLKLPVSSRSSGFSVSGIGGLDPPRTCFCAAGLLFPEIHKSMRISTETSQSTHTDSGTATWLLLWLSIEKQHCIHILNNTAHSLTPANKSYAPSHVRHFSLLTCCPR